MNNSNFSTTIEINENNIQKQGTQNSKSVKNDHDKGTFFTSTFTIIYASIGPTFLTLSSNAKNSGFLLEIIILIVGGLLSKMSMTMMMETELKTGILSYGEQIESGLGKFWRRIFDVIIQIGVFGLGVYYQILFTSFFWDSCNIFGIQSQYQEISHLILTIAFGFLTFFISLNKKVHQLRYCSYYMVSFVVTVSFCMIYQLAKQHNQQDIKEQIKFFDLNVFFFSSFSTTLQSYYCHLIFHPLISELEKPSKEQMQRISTLGSIVTFTIFMTVTNIGYFTWLNDTKSIIILNYTEFYFSVLKLIYAMSLIVKLPVNVYPTRLAFLEYVGKKNNQWIDVSYTLMFYVSTAFVAYFYPYAKSVIGFLGGLLGTNIIIVFPCAYYIKTFGWNQKSEIFFTISVFVAILGYIGAVSSQFYS